MADGDLGEGTRLAALTGADLLRRRGRTGTQAGQGPHLGASRAHVAEELQRTVETQVRAERQAQEAGAAGKADLADGSRTVAEPEAERAAKLGKIQAKRDEWDRQTEQAREQAPEAQQELARRGVEAESTERPERQPGADVRTRSRRPWGTILSPSRRPTRSTSPRSWSVAATPSQA